jgi:hypothetical protein
VKGNVELRQGHVAADKESASDKRTNLAQGDTQLIDTGQFQWLAHGGSVAQYAVSLKISPRNLALREGTCDQTPFEALRFPLYHSELALCQENGPKIVSFDVRRRKNGRFLPTGEISSSPGMRMETLV